MITNKDIVIVWQERDIKKKRYNSICTAMITVGADVCLSKYMDTPQMRTEIEERLRSTIYAKLYADVRNMLPPLLYEVLKTMDPLRANIEGLQAKFAQIMMMMAPDVTSVVIGDNSVNNGDI